MSIRLRYLTLAVVTLVVEILIATKLTGFSFIRGSVGDMLVVIFLFFAIKSIRNYRPLPLAAGVFLFACAVEVAQYFHLARILGLKKGSILRIMIGDTFQMDDIFCYLLGCIAALIIDFWVTHQRAPRIRVT